MIVYNAQAVVLGNKVYIGGGIMNPGSSFRLLIYDFTENSWDTLNTPTCWYALSNYYSQLVLIGGMDPSTQDATNELWVLDEQHHWTQPLPPMTTERCYGSAVGVGDHLIVAGGYGGSDDTPLATVEVYDGHQWRQVQSLPRACSWMKSALYEGDWYLTGGTSQDREVYHTSLESLIANSEGVKQTSVWENLPDACLKWSTLAVFKNYLLTIGGGDPYKTTIHAFYPSTNSWVNVGDLPLVYCSPCTAVLPTGELLVVGRDAFINGLSHIFKANTRGVLDICESIQLG